MLKNNQGKQDSFENTRSNLVGRSYIENKIQWLAMKSKINIDLWILGQVFTVFKNERDYIHYIG